MGRAEYELVFTDPTGATLISDPIGQADPDTGTPGHTEIQLKPRHNEAGFGQFTTAALPWVLATMYTPDTRVVVRRRVEYGDGVEVEMAGYLEVPEHGFTVQRDGADGPGTITAKFTSDEVICGYRLVFPNPAQMATAQTTTARYAISSLNPEDAMRNLVNLNCGPGALVARRWAGLTMGPDNGLMAGVTVSTSFTRDTVVSDALREVSRLAGGLGLGYRIVQTASGLQFEVFQPQDLANQVVFSRPMGNIGELTFSQSAPTATVAIVGDATAGVGRVIKERINAAAHTAGWQRREVFVDARGVQNATEQQQAGDAVVAEQGAHTRVSVKAIDTPQTRYGYDYGRGDQVSVQPYPGGPFVSALVLGADITVTPERGETVEPIIGTDNEILLDAKGAEIRKLWRTIARMQGAL